MSLDIVVPDSLDLTLGMAHVGLSDAAAKLERMPAFKRVFQEIVGKEMGIGDTHTGMATRLPTDGTRLPEHHTSFLASFGADGAAPAYEVRRFVDAAIEAVAPPNLGAGGRIKTADVQAECCYWTKTGWRTCSSYLLTKDDLPYTARSIVDRYHATVKPIDDALVRQQLEAVRITIDVCWQVTV